METIEKVREKPAAENGEAARAAPGQERPAGTRERSATGRGALSHTADSRVEVEECYIDDVEAYLTGEGS